MNSNRVNLTWTYSTEGKYLKFTFGEKLTKEEASKIILEWKQIFATHEYGKVKMIWDCAELTGYDPMARVLWQKTLKELSDQIDIVWLIIPSKMIRTAAHLISLLVKFDLKPISSEEEIQMLLTQPAY